MLHLNEHSFNIFCFAPLITLQSSSHVLSDVFSYRKVCLRETQTWLWIVQVIKFSCSLIKSCSNKTYKYVFLNRKHCLNTVQLETLDLMWLFKIMDAKGTKLFMLNQTMNTSQTERVESYFDSSVLFRSFCVDLCLQCLVILCSTSHWKTISDCRLFVLWLKLVLGSWLQVSF